MKWKTNVPKKREHWEKSEQAGVDRLFRKGAKFGPPLKPESSTLSDEEFSLRDLVGIYVPDVSEGN